jgi:hypothetical protein
MLTSKYTLDVIGAHGDTGPSSAPSFAEAESLPPLNSATAPYPTVPAIANVIKFRSTAVVAGDDDFLSSFFLPPPLVAEAVDAVRRRQRLYPRALLGEGGNNALGTREDTRSIDGIYVVVCGRGTARGGEGLGGAGQYVVRRWGGKNARPVVA